MHYIDIIILVILAIFAIVGFKRGLIDAVLSLLNVVVSIAIAVLVSKPFAGFLEQCFKVTQFLQKNLTGMFASWSENFGTAVQSAITGTQAIEASTLSGWQQTILKLMIGECAIETGTAPAQVFANIVAPIALITLSGILAFILIRLAIFLLSKLFNVLLQSKTLSGIDRLLGFLLGLVKGALVICVLMGITIFIPNEAILNEIDKTQITKVVYTPVTDFIKTNIADKLKEWADDIMPDEAQQTSFKITVDNQTYIYEK